MKKGKLRYNLVSGIFAAMFVVVVFTLTSAVFANTSPVPVVTNPDAKPGTIPADGITKFVLNVTVTDDIAVDNVTINLNSIGGTATTVMQRLNGNIYSNETSAAVGAEPGTYYLKVNATDINGNYNDDVSITLVVTATTGDTDGSGEVDIADAMYLAKNVLGMSGFETIHADGDVDSSGEVDIADAMYLAKHVLGMSGFEVLYP